MNLRSFPLLNNSVIIAIRRMRVPTITVFPEACYHMQWDLGIGQSILALCASNINLDVTKMRNGLESGLANGLSQFLWNATFITVLLF